MIKKICKFCKKVFEIYPCQKHHKFCSPKCGSQSRKIIIIKKCKICYKKFNLNLKVDRKSRKFCSRKCFFVYLSKVTTGKKRPNVAGKNNYFWSGGKIKKKCDLCKKIYLDNQKGKQRFCSSKCYWKVMKNLYNGKQKLSYKKAFSFGRITSKHRAIMEQHLKRKLIKTEIVHHKNFNPIDNRLENLELLTQKEHVKRHFKYIF